MTYSTARNILRRIPGQPASDGAGVRLRRSLGSRPALRLDPFLMLDEFSSSNPDDYVAGFPEHPHRGFETVTYMLEGRMQHRDHMRNTGDLGPGGVQWMTAGRGVIHSEMPQQHEGRMRGFQLWINLPAAEKMQPASYRDIPAAEIPEITPAEGVRLRLIAGRLDLSGETLSGAVNGDGARSTDPLYLDLRLEPGAQLALPVPPGHHAFVYPFEGEASIAGRPLPAHDATVLSDGDHVVIDAGEAGAAMLLLAGKPIGEGVVQYGPFVMNTREEIEQALEDYRRGVLTA
jgi:hypothetical protein